MATFPLFIAPLNHALTTLLWPIFAALFYFSPFFWIKLQRLCMHYFLLYIILIFESLSFHWYSGGDLGSGHINQICWDKFGEPCLDWSNTPQKCLLSKEQLLPEYFISFIQFLTCICYAAPLPFTHRVITRGVGRNMSIVILEKDKLFMGVRVGLGVGESAEIDRQTAWHIRVEGEVLGRDTSIFLLKV